MGVDGRCGLADGVRFLWQFGARWVLALILGVGVGLRADEVRVLFAPASEPVTAGGVATIWLHWLNGSKDEASGLAPLSIQGTLSSAGVLHPVTLKLTSPYNTAPLPIPPGGFDRRAYFLQLPAGVSGQAVLALEFAEANLVALDILPGAPSSAAAAPAPTLADEAAPIGAARANDPVAFFREHFYPHEPLYFIAGTESPNAKFQISFKYQLFMDECRLLPRAGWITNLYIGYTQTSLWDWNTPSAPFFDSSYKPEFLYSAALVRRDGPGDWFRLDLQSGLQHESNGRDGAESRSMNYAYLRPFFTFGREGAFNFTLAPKVFVYLGDLSDNADIADYRGHVELRGVLGWDDSVQLSALGRVGEGFDHGSVQLDLTYPMWRLPFLKSSVFLDVQYFTGYGESLLDYNERTWAVRAGFALSR